jgi:hypothetical protein
MPDDHRPAMPQVTAVDDQFGTHTAFGLPVAERNPSRAGRRSTRHVTAPWNQLQDRVAALDAEDPAEAQVGHQKRHSAWWVPAFGSGIALPMQWHGPASGQVQVRRVTVR